jgi:hypothetical protein
MCGKEIVMPARILVIGCLALLALWGTSATAVADPPNDDGDWLTWTVKDCKNSTLDLSDHENKTVYVVLFSPGDKESCTLMRGMAAYIRGHTNKADRVLGFCSDDAGAGAIKLYIRQEEWKKRTDAWKAAQDAARLAAKLTGQHFVADPMPDYLQQIKDELEDPQDLDVLIAYHVPFKTCQCVTDMGRWLTKRKNPMMGTPRLLKINPQGHVVQQWASLPQNFSVD